MNSQSKLVWLWAKPSLAAPLFSVLLCWGSGTLWCSVEHWSPSRASIHPLHQPHGSGSHLPGAADLPSQDPLATWARGAEFGAVPPWGTQNNVPHDGCRPSAKKERAGRSQHLPAWPSRLKLSGGADRRGPSPTTCWCPGPLPPHHYGPADAVLRAYTLTQCHLKAVMVPCLSPSLIPILWEGGSNPHCNPQRCPAYLTPSCLLLPKYSPGCGSCRGRKGDWEASPYKKHSYGLPWAPGLLGFAR